MPGIYNAKEHSLHMIGPEATQLSSADGRRNMEPDEGMIAIQCARPQGRRA